MTRRLSAFALSLAVLATVPLRAQQDTSTDPQAQESFMDRVRRIARETQIIERLNGTIDGWYPRLGGMTRGSGLVLGPGYRTHILDDRVLVDVSAALSTKFYKAADAHFRWARALHDRLEFWTDLRLEDYPQEDFFGMGRSSRPATRTSYDFSSANGGGRVVMTLRPRMQLGTRVEVVAPSISRGADPEFPSIEQVFTDADAPGLRAQPKFVDTAIFFDLDSRDTAGNPGHGGLYHASLGFWNDVTLHQYNFTRFDANALQYVALTPDKRHVLSGRFGLSTLNNGLGDRVPFYFFPYVGGSDTIRSLDEFRFRDENAIWAGIEYTWTPFAHLSFAGFMDTGKVAHGWDEVNFADMKQAHGFGIRVHTSKQRLARIDFAAGGGEGWQVMLKLGPSF